MKNEFFGGALRHPALFENLAHDEILALIYLVISENSPEQMKACQNYAGDLSTNLPVKFPPRNPIKML